MTRSILESTPECNSNKLLLGLSLSIILHGLGIWLLLSSKLPKQAPPETKPTPIQARLVSMPRQQQNEPLQKADETIDKSVEFIKSVEPLVQENPNAVAEQEPTRQVAQSNDDKQQVSQTSEEQNPAVKKPNYSVTQSLGRQLQAMQSEKQRVLVQQEARNYQQRKNQVDIPGFQGKFDFETASEKHFRNISTRVNCESHVNNTIAVASTFLGGTFRCSEKTDFAPFVEARLKQKGLNQEKEKPKD